MPRVSEDAPLMPAAAKPSRLRSSFSAASDSSRVPSGHFSLAYALLTKRLVSVYSAPLTSKTSSTTGAQRHFDRSAMP